MERRRAKNPIDGMLRLSTMMWDQMYAVDGFFTIPSLWEEVTKINNNMKEQVASLKKVEL